MNFLKRNWTIKVLLNVLFARRVRFHKAVGINDLDEWPALKVNNSLTLARNIVYSLTIVRFGLNALPQGPQWKLASMWGSTSSPKTPIC